MAEVVLLVEIGADWIQVPLKAPRKLDIGKAPSDPKQDVSEDQLKRAELRLYKNRQER